VNRNGIAIKVLPLERNIRSKVAADHDEARATPAAARHCGESEKVRIRR
jgi:hypothetical protein